MPKHFKSLPTFSENTNVNVDREKGIIKNIVIAQYGANKNGTFFSETFLQSLAEGANNQGQGVKSRFGHPNMCSTSLGTYLGRYKNFTYNEKKVFADLHLDDISKKTEVEGKGIKMFDYVMDMAENNPDMFGNSIHIPSPDFEDEPVVIDDKRYSSHIYNGIIASDVVDSPAATDSLFEDGDDLGIITTKFLDDNPEIFKAIQRDESIIEDFLERYFNSKNNNDMGLIDRIKKKFSAKETFDIEETLADGAIVTIKTEGESPAVGDQVVDAEGRPVPDGDHTTKDGSVIKTESGAITEIVPAEESEEDAPAEEPTMAEMMSSIHGLVEKFEAFDTQYKKDQKENIEAFEAISDEVAKFNKKHNDLAKTIESKEIPDYEGDSERGGKFKSSSAYDPDKVREERSKRKNKK